MVVSPEFAKDCMANYKEIMEGEDLQVIQDSFTASISFSTPEFKDWLLTNDYLDNTTSFRISLGIYSPEAAAEIGHEEYTGRLTAFVWPMQNAQEFEPYNVGELVP